MTTDEVRLYTVELNDTDALTVIAALRHVAQHHGRELIESVADTFQHHYQYGREVTIDKYGTIIEGTLKDSDIGPACLDWLREHAPDAYQEAVTVCSRVYNLEIDNLNTNFWDTDGGWFLHEVVCQLMRKQAPDGYYFGTHLGDGADIGFHLEEI